MNKESINRQIEQTENRLMCLKIVSMESPWDKIMESVVDMLYYHRLGYDFKVEFIPKDKHNKIKEVK